MAQSNHGQQHVHRQEAATSPKLPRAAKCKKSDTMAHATAYAQAAAISAAEEKKKAACQGKRGDKKAARCKASAAALQGPTKAASMRPADDVVKRLRCVQFFFNSDQCGCMRVCMQCVCILVRCVILFNFCCSDVYPGPGPVTTISSIRTYSFA